MAKKFEIGGIMDEFDTNVANDRQKSKGGAVAPQAAGKPGSQDGTENQRGKGSSWRSKQRNAAKTIHFDPILSSKIAQIKEWRKLAGEPNATVEDLVHEMCEEYIANHLAELKEKYKDYIL